MVRCVNCFGSYRGIEIELGPQVFIPARDKPLDLAMFDLNRVRGEGFKPTHVLWTSSLLDPTTKGVVSDWDRWCRKHRKEVPKAAYVLVPREDARVYVIDDVEDVERLEGLYPSSRAANIRRCEPGIDWARVARDYDGVHMTMGGQARTRLPEDRTLTMNGWDVESTAWFRNVFDEVRALDCSMLPPLEREKIPG